MTTDSKSNDDQLPSSSIKSQGQMREYRSLSWLFSVGVLLACSYFVGAVLDFEASALMRMRLS